MIIHIPIELGEHEDCLVGPGHPTQPCGLLFGGAKKNSAAGSTNHLGSYMAQSRNSGKHCVNSSLPKASHVRSVIYII